MKKTKPKTDSRVKRYRAVMIPEKTHQRLKLLAAERGMRLNALVPMLLNKALQ